MELPSEITGGVFGAIAAFCMGLVLKTFGWIAKNTEERLSDVERKVAEVVPRDEIKELLREMRDDSKARSEELGRKLDNHNQTVVDGIVRLESRVDRLYEKAER